MNFNVYKDQTLVSSLSTERRGLNLMHKLQAENKDYDYLYLKNGGIIASFKCNTTKVVFCQFDSQFLYNGYKESAAERYYNLVYKKHRKDGYYNEERFWEVPLWIAEASGLIGNKFSRELHVITDINETVKYLNSNRASYILFSVLDINKQYVQEIINKYKGYAKIIVGGYNLSGITGATILDSMPTLAKYFNFKYEYDLDYSLFKGIKTIPRLTLSKGCKHRCKFCTVPNKLKEVPEKDVIRQVNSFESLKFRLVYLNDKTFGQANNYMLLRKAYLRIRKYNKKFEGFIIQTTCAQTIKPGFIDDMRKCHVKIVELGIETYNDNLLKGLKKPQNTLIIDRAMKMLTGKFKIIPNFIIGIKGETRKTYENTLNFVERYKSAIYAMNIYNLAIYQDTQLAKEIKIKPGDSNENLIEKSFYTKKEHKANVKFFNEIFKLGIKMLNS